MKSQNKDELLARLDVKPGDRFVSFNIFEDGRLCGGRALHMMWGEQDVLVELKAHGYPVVGDRVTFVNWPSDDSFSMEVVRGEKTTVFSFRKK